MALTRKRVLVTGGAGFLGSHLCERLIRDGDDVLCVDNYFTGRKDNIAHLIGDPHFEAMRHDITFPLYVEVDEIYNLACPASPVHYQYDPVQTTKTSVIGAINMLGLAKRVGAKIMQASTSEVYGDPSVHPQTEDYRGNVNPLGPRACYDEGKRCAETLFFELFPSAQDAHQSGAHLQHVWAAHASERRPCGVELHRPGIAWRGHRIVRQRQSNKGVLLRR
jgi:UDP-glucuronate decarboxylase